MRITSSGEVLVIGAELLVDVEAVDVGVSMVGESMAITLSWVRFPFSGSWSRVLPSIHTARACSTCYTSQATAELGEQHFFGHESVGVIDQYLLFLQ